MGLGWWWRWFGWKGVLKRISAAVTAGLDAMFWGLEPGGACIGIICLHFRLRPFTAVANVQMPFHGEAKL